MAKISGVIHGKWTESDMGAPIQSVFFLGGEIFPLNRGPKRNDPTDLLCTKKGQTTLKSETNRHRKADFTVSLFRSLRKIRWLLATVAGFSRCDRGQHCPGLGTLRREEVRWHGWSCRMVPFQVCLSHTGAARPWRLPIFFFFRISFTYGAKGGTWMICTFTQELPNNWPSL